MTVTRALSFEQRADLLGDQQVTPHEALDGLLLAASSVAHARGHLRLQIKAQALFGPTWNPSSAYAIACSNNCSNGSLPNRDDKPTHALTAPGTVTASQPRAGITRRP